MPDDKFDETNVIGTFQGHNAALANNATQRQRQSTDPFGDFARELRRSHWLRQLSEKEALALFVAKFPSAKAEARRQFFAALRIES